MEDLEEDCCSFPNLDGKFLEVRRGARYTSGLSVCLWVWEAGEIHSRSWADLSCEVSDGGGVSCGALSRRGSVNWVLHEGHVGR